MATAGQPTSSLSLDDLMLLNDEMASLVRAGIPLGGGLDRLASDVPKRLARCTEALSLELKRGQSLEAALRATEQQFPPVYLAVVEVGARSGRLSAALESLAATGRRLAELRQVALAALIYPSIVVLLAYGFFAVFASGILRPMLAFLADLRVTPPGWITFLFRVGELDARWWWAGLGLFFVAWAVWAYRSARAELVSGRGGWSLFWLPVARRMMANSRRASFAELLMLMVEHGVPLAESLRLATEATGDARLRRALDPLLVRLQQGGTPAASEWQKANLPPLLAWSLLSSDRRGQFLVSLRFAAEHYRRSALAQAYWIRTFLPVVLALLLGGGVVILMVTTLVYPWAEILHELFKPATR